MSTTCVSGQLTTSEVADFNTDTGKQQGLNGPDAGRRVPLQGGRAPTPVNADLQQQAVAQALNTLQHSLLGHWFA